MPSLSRLARFIRNGGWRVLQRPAVAANWLLNEYEQRSHAVRMRSLPSKVEIEISDACNLHCRHCLRSAENLRPQAARFVDSEAFLRILGQFPQALTLTLTGAGEPLLHPHFLDIVAAARRMSPHLNILIYTNLTLLGRTVSAAELMAAGISQVHVSLDAADAETYRRIRGVDQYEEVTAGIRELVARRREGSGGPLIGVNFTMMRDNFEQAAEYVRVAHALGVDYIGRPSLLLTSWGYRDGAAGMTKAAVARALREAASAARELSAPMALDGYMSDPEGWLAGYEGHRSNYYLNCVFLRNCVQIDAAGNFRLCCRHPLASEHSYGNVLETPFVELWNSEIITGARRRQNAGELPLPPCAETCVRPDPMLAP